MSSCTFRCVPHTFFSSSSDVVSGGCHSPVTAPVSRPFFLKYPFFTVIHPFLKSVKAGSFLRLRLSADVCFFTMSDWHGCFRKNTCINSKTGSASYRNQYEWKTFSDEFPAKSNHISLCKFMEQLPLFPKVSVADSQIPSLPINSRIFLFLHAQKAYSWINYLLPSYPIKI